MRTQGTLQTGSSTFGNLFLLALLAYAIYIAFQWVPQLVESATVDGILSTVKDNYRVGTGEGGIETAISKQLNVNAMLDLEDSFNVTPNGTSFLVSCSYQRELNLLFDKRMLQYDKKITLP